MDESMTRPTDGRPSVAVVTVGDVRFGMQLDVLARLPPLVPVQVRAFKSFVL